MAMTTIGLVLILVLYSALVITCNAAVVGGLLPQPAGGNNIADQTIFNVLNFGAKPNSELISTQVMNLLSLCSNI